MCHLEFPHSPKLVLALSTQNEMEETRESLSSAFLYRASRLTSTRAGLNQVTIVEIISRVHTNVVLPVKSCDLVDVMKFTFICTSCHDISLIETYLAAPAKMFLERETGFEPATFCLASRCSTN